MVTEADTPTPEALADQRLQAKIEHAIGISFLAHAPDDATTGAARWLRDAIMAIIRGEAPEVCLPPPGA